MTKSDYLKSIFKNMLKIHIVYRVMRNEKDPKNESKLDLNFIKHESYMYVLKYLEKNNN